MDDLAGRRRLADAGPLEIENDGRWYEALAWGVFTDTIVRHIGADPAVHRAIGVGHGLERLAMLRYGIDDIRRIDGRAGGVVRVQASARRKTSQHYRPT